MCGPDRDRSVMGTRCAAPGDGRPLIATESNSYDSPREHQIFRRSYGSGGLGTLPRAGHEPVRPREGARPRGARGWSGPLLAAAATGRPGQSHAEQPGQRDIDPVVTGAMGHRPGKERGRARQLRASGRQGGLLIEAQRPFTVLAGAPVAEQLQGHSEPLGNHWPTILCARFAGLLSGEVADRGRSGRLCTRAVVSARPAGWAARRSGRPGGRERAPATILVYSPASPAGRTHERASALARAMLGRDSLDHA